MRNRETLGELPWTERRSDEIGWSKGSPSTPATNSPPPTYVEGSTKIEVVGTTSHVVVTRQLRRAYLFFQNRGSGTIWIAFNNSPGDFILASPAIGHELPPGATLEIAPSGLHCVASDVYAVADSPNNNLAITEGVRIGDA